MGNYVSFSFVAIISKASKYFSGAMRCARYIIESIRYGAEAIAFATSGKNIVRFVPPGTNELLKAIPSNPSVLTYSAINCVGI